MDGGADAYVTLRSGARMPRVGFGTAGLGERTAVAVGAALAAGYRLLDSAQAREWYREDLVGEALAATALPREAVFVTTKIHPRHLGYAATAERVAVSLRELRTRHVDLLLLHYPSCWGDLCGGDTPAGTWRDSWRALEAAKAAGQARALGVSNFDAAQLRELLAWAKEPPDVVQAHSDPFSQARGAQRRAAVRPASRPQNRAAEPGAAARVRGARRGVPSLQQPGAAVVGRRLPPQPRAARARGGGRLCGAPRHAGAGGAAMGAAQRTGARTANRSRDRPARHAPRAEACSRAQCIIPKTSNPEHMRLNRELGFALTEAELSEIDALDGHLPPKDQYARH
jgi:diketogulonate reductase-like aldo/keto reductase